MPKYKVTTAQVVAALEDSHQSVIAAARKLKVTKVTIYNHLKGITRPVKSDSSNGHNDNGNGHASITLPAEPNKSLSS